MARYVAAVNAARPAVNVVALVGHSTLRVATMDDPYRAATAAEQARMGELLREGLAAGAAGLSSGVFYTTGAAGGVYTTHIRQEMDKVLDSLDEAFATARRGNVPLVVSTTSAPGRATGAARWRRWPTSMRRAVSSRSASTATRTSLARRCCAATWSTASSTSSSPGRRRTPRGPARTLAGIAAEWGCSQKEACERLQPGGACYFQMREDDVQRVLACPATMIGSDGLPHDQHPHPRL
jgi:N-acyl-D-amino-acid deacylase